MVVMVFESDVHSESCKDGQYGHRVNIYRFWNSSETMEFDLKVDSVGVAPISNIWMAS